MCGLQQAVEFGYAVGQRKRKCIKRVFSWG